MKTITTTYNPETHVLVPREEMHEPLCPALDGGACECVPTRAVDKAWARFCGVVGRGPDAPYPGMIEAFESHYAQAFTDKDWRAEAGVWAAAWKAAMLAAAPQQGAQSKAYRPDEKAVREACDMITRVRDAAEHWGGWSGTMSTCEAAINLLRYGHKPNAATQPTDQPTPETVAEQHIQAAIDRAPEPLRRLGEWLSRVLNDDQWATAERMLLSTCGAAAPEAPEHRHDDKPVAWRVHPFDYGIGHDGVYAMTMRPDQVEAWNRKGWKVEPLYAAPQPAKSDHWQQYAKPDETAQQCIERHRAEQDALMTLLAQARAEQAAKAEGQEAVAFLVEGWHEGKLIAKTLEHTADEARGTAAVFAGHYPFIHTYALFTTPPRREWVGLTDEELLACLGPDAVRIPPGWRTLARAIEAACKEKNHG